MARAPGKHTIPFQPLNEKDHQFRLLTIHPGTLDAPIQCSLSYLSLKLQLPAYEALSCTPGQGSADWLIIVEGCEFGVREHVSAALRALRYQAKPRNIWIDEVCINAFDAVECSSQMQLRGQIFGRADCVVVWLGPGTIKTHETFRVIDRHIESAKYPELGKVNWDDAYGHAIITNLAEEVLSRKWWSWVTAVYEVAVSGNVIIRCGSLYLPWTSFVTLIEWLRGQKIQSKKLLSNKFLDLTNIIKASYVSGAPQKLCQLMIRLCQYDSSDFRDTVTVAFALREWTPNQIPPVAAYTKSIQEVQLEVVDACIQLDQSLDFLSMAGLLESKAVNMRSSWLPELQLDQPAWRNRNVLADKSYSPLVAPSNTNSSSLFSASAKHPPKATITIVAGRPLLTAAGVLIDTIEIIPLSNLGRSTPSLLKTWDIVLSYAFGTLEAFQSLTDRWVSRMKPRILNPESKKANYVPCLVDGTMEQCELRYELFRKARDKMLKAVPNYNLRRTRPHYPTPAKFQNAYFRTILTDRTASRERVGASYLKACMLDVEGGNQEGLALLNDFLPHVSPQDRGAVFQDDFLAAVEASLQFRTLFVTKTGYIGLGPLSMQPNDIVCVLLGYSVPVVLRREGPASYNVVGECYVHGIMHGEALDEEDWVENMVSFKIV